MNRVAIIIFAAVVTAAVIFVASYFLAYYFEAYTVGLIPVHPLSWAAQPTRVIGYIASPAAFLIILMQGLIKSVGGKT